MRLARSRDGPVENAQVARLRLHPDRWEEASVGRAFFGSDWAHTDRNPPQLGQEISITTPTPSELVYAGFWIRVGATLIDAVLIALLTLPVLHGIYGADYWESEAIVQGPADFLISWVMPALGIILFWIYKQATPGKMAVSAQIVDARTGRKASNAQYIGRYFGYIVAALPLGLGIIWVAFDRRKQGWHDKLAGTIVIRT